MKRMKNDTAHYDASTVLSTLKMLSTEMDILVHTPPKKSLHFWLFLDRILYWYFTLEPEVPRDQMLSFFVVVFCCCRFLITVEPLGKLDLGRFWTILPQAGESFQRSL